MRIMRMLLWTAAGLFFSCSSAEKAFTEYVDPFIGTDAHGHTFPGATAPFGMVQLSPDTRLDGWDGCSGYHYSDGSVWGFSHTHLSGTGCLDYGDVLMMPVTGYPADTLDRNLYSSRFSHRREEASPGYYGVWLERYGIQAELTAGLRCGMHRYDFSRSAAGDPQIVIDLEHRDQLLDSQIRQCAGNAVSGFRRSSSWSQDQTVYFYAEFSQPFSRVRFFGARGVLLSFDRKEADRILVKVGISSVSEENARMNLLSELPEGDFGFDGLRRKTVDRWEKFLSKVDVRGDGREDLQRLKIFYTALYHAAIAPNLYSDVNGEYRGMDRQVHVAEGFDRYTVFSLWDTFRSLHPLFTLIERERTRDFLKSFLSVYRESGELPMWELAGFETHCMIGYNAAPVIADALVKGIDGVDAEELLEAMVATANREELGIPDYRRMNVVPAELEHESVSKTLEYAYGDWCIAQVADLLLKETGKGTGEVAGGVTGMEEGKVLDEVIGKEKERYRQVYEEYLHASSCWQNVFDPETCFMRPMLNGMWMRPFDPAEVNNHYTEANAWQYSFFVPQDLSGLMERMGGEEAFCEKIDALFSAPERTSGRTQVDITGMVGQYAHGNEPSHHIAYLYAYAGQHWKTCAVVRHILEELYTAEPDGLCGNDDCGQMSAWYVLSAAGLYPVTPGSEVFVLTSPLFREVKFSLENGKVFTVSSLPERGSVKRSPYVRSVSLNGREHLFSFVRFGDLADGGELEIRLCREPDFSFGRDPESRPVSAGCSDFLRNPWFVAESDIFSDSLQVTVAGDLPEEAVLYRSVTGAAQEAVSCRPVRGAAQEAVSCCSVRGAAQEAVSCHLMAGAAQEENVSAFIRDDGRPFMLRESAVVRAYAELPDGRRTPVVETYFHKLKDDMDISTSCVYNPQYHGRGERGLIDGLRGSENWKTGGWQGYQDTDFTAVVDLREVREVSLIGSGYCQDMRSWIWMPQYVEYQVSEDGQSFVPAGRVENSVGVREDRVQTRDFVLDLSEHPLKARYVKVFAKNFGTIPAWHPGAGGEGFIFIDEIWVK